METFIFVVLGIILFRFVVDKLGKDVISSKLYSVFLKISANKDYKDLQVKKSELRAIYKERLGISAQDQYAKWTKLNRKYDKLKVEVDLFEKKVVANQAAALSKISMLVTFITVAPLWYYRVFRRSRVLFRLPEGMFPSLVEYWLAFPSVPKGAIGLGAWIFIVNNLLTSIEFIYKTLVSDKAPQANVEIPTKDEAKSEPKIVEVDE